MLFGRVGERELIERLLGDARHGRGGALVIRGEPGIGKTALLRYAIDLAEAMTVATCVGVESEAELEYSGLVELCRPLLSGLDGLPEHQADVLRGALGLSATRPGDRFAVGASLLGLLALVAESRPLLVVVDDGQWVDAASVAALSFAARRLSADGVAFLAATREGSDAFGAGFEEVTLEGLDEAAAARLLDEVASSPVPADVVARLCEETRGNPLGLVELPRVLTEEQLSGTAPIQQPLPVGSGVERTYAGSIEGLPEEAREALLVLALAPSGDAELVAGALDGAGGAHALEAAEDAGLVELRDTRFVFRHPLVRSAVVHAAQPSRRRWAHRRLADACARAGDEERRAWHLAAAALGPDEEAAEALAAVAAAARARGGYEAASEGFERAARLTASEAPRLQRLADAAEAAWSVGDTARTAALVDEIGEAGDEVVRARVLRLRGRMELQRGSSERATALFLESSALLAGRDVTDAVVTIGLAVFSCHFGGRIPEALELSRRARSMAPAGSGRPELDADYLMSRSLHLAGALDEGTALLESVLERLLEDQSARPAIMRAATAYGVLERGREALEKARDATRLARDEGPMVLTYALHLTTQLGVRHGRWATALVAADEGLALARDLEQPTVAAHFLVARAHVEAARGQATECRASSAEALELLGAAEMGLPAEQVSCALGMLELGLGRLDVAATTFAESSRNVAAMRLHDREILPEPDLVEALVGLGRADEAAAALDAWLERGGGEATRLGAALAAAARGRLAGDDAFEGDFREALELHGLADDPFAEARTRLGFGERLRRAGRRTDSRGELRSALETFERLEAEPWIARTRRELRATGEKLGRRAARSGDELTAQELQVALQVAEGKSNREVGAALFLSPKTVEFHLARVYRKLDLSSRAELIRRVAESSDAALTGATVAG